MIWNRKKELKEQEKKAVSKAAENMLACRLTAIDLRKEAKPEGIQAALIFDDVAESISGLLRIVTGDQS